MTDRKKPRKQRRIARREAQRDCAESKSYLVKSKEDIRRFLRIRRNAPRRSIPAPLSTRRYEV